MKFLIIGGDAAGMSAASRAKRNFKDMEVIVLEKHTMSHTAPVACHTTLLIRKGRLKILLSDRQGFSGNQSYESTSVLSNRPWLCTTVWPGLGSFACCSKSIRENNMMTYE
jgi:hypothetical protein